ncbi:CBD9-like protein [Thozetella sp. PMI_491]|nr:CBD9-like protein [Thozetella sp. PMI_491]
MAWLAILTLGVLALGVGAQDTTSYTDEVTGIIFQGYTSDTGMTVGMAASQDGSSKDFIGQITAPLTQGWAGITLTGKMANALLVVAYPSGDSVVSSLRQAVTYANPDVISDADVVLKPIADGTYVNSTAFVFTFLCSNCILDDGRTFTMETEVPLLAWAMSKNALSNPSSASAVLNFHSYFGTFGIDLPNAKFADFETWAGTASDPTTPTTLSIRSSIPPAALLAPVCSTLRSQA